MVSDTHDYTNARRGFGHDITYHPLDEKGIRLKATGWGHGLKVGHFILLSNRAGSTRYQVESINYFTDPADMWGVVLVFAPRQCDAA